MTTITASDEFSGYLIGKDVVEAGDIARELRKPNNTSNFERCSDGRQVEQLVDDGGRFYTGIDANKITPFNVRNPLTMFFCSVPRKGKIQKWQEPFAWYQISKTQYHYGIYLTKRKGETIDAEK